MRSGYVTLYAVPGRGLPHAINHNEPGEHFRTKAAADGALTGNGAGGATASAHLGPPPPFSTLPVYDLHMRPLGPAGGPGGLRALAARAAVGGGFGDGGCGCPGMSRQESESV